MRRVLLLVAAFALVGCGEREQVVVYKQGKYQGKPDNQSWANDPLPASSAAASGPRATARAGKRASSSASSRNTSTSAIYQ